MKSYLNLFFISVFLTFQIGFLAAQNNRPVAVNDTLIVHGPGLYTVNVLDNDYDPDGDSIFLYDIDDQNSGLNISVIDNQVFVSPNNYRYYPPIRYEIKDTTGKTDHAKIVVMFIEHPDAVKTVNDTILVNSQTPIELDLLQNDNYTGDEDIKLLSVNSWYRQGTFEILSDSQSVRYTSNAYNGPSIFSYTVVEKGGNRYASNGSGFIFVYHNEEEPIAIADTFEVQAGQVYYLDVLANDISSGTSQINSILDANDYLSIQDSKIRFDVPSWYHNNFVFSYDMIDIDKQLKSIPVKVMVHISGSPDTPIANIDTVEFLYTDIPQEIFPLQNDVNPSGNPLIIQETGTESMVFNKPSQTGWFHMTYHCRDTINHLMSHAQSIHIHVLPPDSIEISDVYLDYVMGDELENRSL